MLPSEYLRKGWCQKVGARDGNGRAVFWHAPLATQWCLSSAWVIASVGFENWRLFQKTAWERLECSPSTWNDHRFRKQEEVIDLSESIEEQIGLATAPTRTSRE